MRVRCLAGAGLVLVAATAAAGCGSAERRTTTLSPIQHARLERSFVAAGLVLDPVPRLVGAPPAYWVETRLGAPAAGAIVLFPTLRSAVTSGHPAGAVVVANAELSFFGNATRSQRQRMLVALESAAFPPTHA